MRRVCVIANPASGRGRGSRILPQARAVFASAGVGDVRTTTSKGDEGALARRAVEEGFDTLVVIGGDGTWGNVANAILDAGAGSTVRLALLAGGTGNDFAKTVGAPARDLQATARLAIEGPDVAVDVGLVERKHFLNVVGFGFDMAVLEDIDRITWVRGDALYLYAAVRQLFDYPGLEIDISSAGARRGVVRHLMLIVANGKNFGGAFRIAPHASPADGRLDAVSIHDASPMRRVRLFIAAVQGRHAEHPEVVVEQSAHFRLRFATPPAYETDGEYNRAASNEVEVACVPRALRVVTPLDRVAMAEAGVSNARRAAGGQGA